MMSRIATGRGASFLVEDLGAGRGYVPLPPIRGEPMLGLGATPGGGAPLDTHGDRESVAAGQAGVTARNAAIAAGASAADAQQAAIAAAAAVTAKEKAASGGSGSGSGGSGDGSSGDTGAGLTKAQIGILGGGALVLALGVINALRPVHHAMGYLGPARRRRMKSSQFALPGMRYPIDTKKRARNALARASQHLKQAERCKVVRAVCAKYPSISVCRGESSSRKLSSCRR